MVSCVPRAFDNTLSLVYFLDVSHSSRTYSFTFNPLKTHIYLNYLEPENLLPTSQKSLIIQYYQDQLVNVV